MAKVTYKNPLGGMDRMIKKAGDESRPSIGITEVKSEIYYLNIDIIIPYANQARREISEENIIELAQSIKTHGIIQPLQVIKSAHNADKFEVVSGERRLCAAKYVGLTKIPCIILNKIDDADEIALIENIQREDLHPIELADAIEKILRDNKYLNQKELGDKIGISKQKISHLLAISRMPEDVKKHLMSLKNLNISYVKNIAYLKDVQTMRDKVFKVVSPQTPFKSVIKLSFNGGEFKIDSLKVDSLSPENKSLLKLELTKIIEKLNK